MKSLQADFTNGTSDRKVGFDEGRKACYGESSPGRLKFRVFERVSSETWPSKCWRKLLVALVTQATCPSCRKQASSGLDSCFGGCVVPLQPSRRRNVVVVGRAKDSWRSRTKQFVMEKAAALEHLRRSTLDSILYIKTYKY